MATYLGDFKRSAIVEFFWNSYSGSGGSITAVGGTISCYKASNLTQSTQGITTGRAHDGVTGLNRVSIDMADTFYTLGENYQIVLAGATIDGSYVNGNLATFSVENKADSVVRTELTAIPAANVSPQEAIMFTHALARNKITQTSTTQTLRNDGDAGNIGTSTVSDNGTTFTRGKWS